MGTIPQPAYYVYVLARPNGKPFYIGKGKGARVFAHDIEAKSGHKCHKCNVIRKIWRSGSEYQRYIVFTTDVEQDAHGYERELIALHGRENLCNLTDGGEGCSGRVVSAETREKMSIRFKGRKGTRLGHTNSPEHRRKISLAQKGKKLRPEQIEGMRQKFTGSHPKLTDEERARRARQIKEKGRPFQKGQRAGNQGVSPSEETRRKISETLKANSPWKGRKHTPETIEKMRQVQSTRVQKLTAYRAVDPSGSTRDIDNLRQFCKDHVLDYRGVQRAIHDDKLYKRWKFNRIE